MKPARDPKPGGIKSIAESVEKRRNETSALAAQQKEVSLRTKRLRRDASASTLGLSRPASTASLPPPPSPEDIHDQVTSAVHAIQSSTPIGSKAHLNAVRRLRQLLSTTEDPPYSAVLAAGGVAALIEALQPSQGDASALETIFEAAWALTNLSVGDPEVVHAVVPAAPLLIAHLGSGAVAIAEQSAWCLGNIAADDAEYRSTLIANGVVLPLTHLLIQGAKKCTSTAAAAVNEGSIKQQEQQEAGKEEEEVGEDPVISAAATAAWALANLLRGGNTADLSSFLNIQGTAEAVNDILRCAPDGLFTETAWVLAYVTTGGSEALLNRLLHLGVLPSLCSRVDSLVHQVLLSPSSPSEAMGVVVVGTNQFTTTTTETTTTGLHAARAMLTPLLRTLGNLIAGGTATVITEQLFLHSADETHAASLIKSVVICAESNDHGLQREAAWVLANVAGLESPGTKESSIDVIKTAGAIPVLISLLKNQPFHVRKEAAYALMNVCAGGGGGSGDSEAINYLFGGDNAAVRAMLSLMRSADADAAKLGLQFAEMMLRLLPNGVVAVEAADGIDAIEALQFGATASPELQAAAAALVDTYWGTEVGGGGGDTVMAS